MRDSNTRLLAIAFGLFAVLGTARAPAKNAPTIQFAGYKVVPVRYAPVNQMTMAVNINSHPANLLVDTAADQILLDAQVAESLGVAPSSHAVGRSAQGYRYIGSTLINGQMCPVAFVQSLTAGPVNFGSTPVVLLNANPTRATDRQSRIDGNFGADLLVRHKAVIDCRAKRIFFRTDVSQPASFPAPEKFSKVPLRREENGGFTVECSLGGRPIRLLLDTGLAVTTFHQPMLASAGVPMEATRAKSRFTTGVLRPMQLAQIADLRIAEFKVPPTKFGATALPNFALNQGRTKISGIIGIDLLVMSHAIIDLGSMNLFLK